MISSIHAWKVPWTEEPGQLQSMGSQSQTGLSDLKKNVNYLLISFGTQMYNIFLQCEIFIPNKNYGFKVLVNFYFNICFLSFEKINI